MATPPPPPSFASAEKAHPIPWTHEETVHLIHAYQEKWYSLERGQLKSSQWEEIAANVASRCGYSHFDPSKTSVQCRHKMEKLRQRFRSEKHRLSIATAQSSSRWVYFDLMNNLLRGPLPISSARPPIPFDNDEEDQTAEKSDHYSSDYEEEEERNRSKSKSINHILRRPSGAAHGSSSRRRNRNSSEEDEEEDEEEEEEEERDIRVSRVPAAAAEEEGKDMCSKLAAEIRVFADRLVGMESLKMEMMKETEMNRIAMENRRIEMILESEEKILNSIAKAFGSLPPPTKRLKIGHDS